MKICFSIILVAWAREKERGKLVCLLLESTLVKVLSSFMVGVMGIEVGFYILVLLGSCCEAR